jgi:rare lipoprotein A
LLTLSPDSDASAEGSFAQGTFAGLAARVRVLTGSRTLGRVGSLGPALAAARFIWRAVTPPVARLLISLILVGTLTASIVGCRSGNGERLGERVIPLGQPVPKGGGSYLTGSAYQVDGVWYQPREDPAYDRVGTASWYGELFHGRRTANGEIYDMDRLSAASPTLPLPVYARVTNLENRRSIIVRVNDRGPYASDRIMDLSRRSAELLAFRDTGTARVRVQYLGRAPLNGDDSYERRYLASQSWAQVASSGGTSRAGGREPLAVGSITGDGQPQPRAKPDGRGQDWTVAAANVSEAAAAGGGSQLRWQASAQAPAQPSLARPRGIPPGDEPANALPRGLLIQAGSFKSKDNADKAKSLLGGIAQVEVAPTQVEGETIFRVRVGPFADQGAASAALTRVTGAGYTGARIVTN